MRNTKRLTFGEWALFGGIASLGFIVPVLALSWIAALGLCFLGLALTVVGAVTK